MKKIKHLLTALCAFALFVTPVSASNAVEVTAELDEMTITYEVNTNEPITNGRVAITYDENELELVDIVEGGLFDVEDVNADKEAVDGIKTVYFAFASADAYDGEETLALTLVFEADESTVGEEVTITTEFDELADPEEVEQGDSIITIEIPAEETEEPDTPVEPEQPEKKPEEKPEEQPEEDKKPGEGADTGDHSNIGYYVASFVVAAFVLAYLFIRNKKQVNN